MLIGNPLEEVDFVIESVKERKENLIGVVKDGLLDVNIVVEKDFNEFKADIHHSSFLYSQTHGKQERSHGSWFCYFFANHYLKDE